eukprot:Opistho-2@52144
MHVREDAHIIDFVDILGEYASPQPPHHCGTESLPVDAHPLSSPESPATVPDISSILTFAGDCNDAQFGGEEWLFQQLPAAHAALGSAADLDSSCNVAPTTPDMSPEDGLDMFDMSFDAGLFGLDEARMIKHDALGSFPDKLRYPTHMDVLLVRILFPHKCPHSFCPTKAKPLLKRECDRMDCAFCGVPFSRKSTHRRNAKRMFIGFANRLTAEEVSHAKKVFGSSKWVAWTQI